MRGFPQEWVIALIFGAVLLVQFLYKQLRKKAAARQARAQSGTDIQATPVPRKAGPTPMQPDTAGALKPVAAPRAAPTAPAGRALPMAGSRRRRFSRPGLMPDRRAIQDAIVIAAILRPCHAHRPHDVE